MKRDRVFLTWSGILLTYIILFYIWESLKYKDFKDENSSTIGGCSDFYRSRLTVRSKILFCVRKPTKVVLQINSLFTPIFWLKVLNDLFKETWLYGMTKELLRKHWPNLNAPHQFYYLSCIQRDSHILFLIYTAATTAGTNFQLVFMDNVVEAPADGPLEVHVSNTGGQSASVTVSSPGTSCASETKSVPASK